MAVAIIGQAERDGGRGRDREIKKGAKMSKEGSREIKEKKKNKV